MYVSMVCSIDHCFLPVGLHKLIVDSVSNSILLSLLRCEKRRVMIYHIESPLLLTKRTYEISKCCYSIARIITYNKNWWQPAEKPKLKRLKIETIICKYEMLHQVKRPFLNSSVLVMYLQIMQNCLGIVNTKCEWSSIKHFMFHHLFLRYALLTCDMLLNLVWLTNQPSETQKMVTTNHVEVLCKNDLILVKSDVKQNSSASMKKKSNCLYKRNKNSQ